MITRLRTKNIYRKISTITSITDLVEVFNQKPDDKYLRDNPNTLPYMYLSKPSDIQTVTTSAGILIKTARVQMTIVMRDATGNADTSIGDIIDAINDAIASEGCNKIFDWDGINVSEVIEDIESPILYGEKNIPYIVKDYLFKYSAI